MCILQYFKVSFSFKTHLSAHEHKAPFKTTWGNQVTCAFAGSHHASAYPKDLTPLWGSKITAFKANRDHICSSCLSSMDHSDPLHSGSPTVVQLTFQSNSPSYLGQPRRPVGRQQRQGRGTSWLELSWDLTKAGERRVGESVSWTLLSGKAGDPHIYSAFLSREEGSGGGPVAHETSHGSPHSTTTGPSMLHLGVLAKLCSPQI